jgi:hypothetical protein
MEHLNIKRHLKLSQSNNAVSEELFKFSSVEHGISVVTIMILGLFLKLSIFKKY